VLKFLLLEKLPQRKRIKTGILALKQEVYKFFCKETDNEHFKVTGYMINVTGSQRNTNF
jgi:hypothetical protein